MTLNVFGASLRAAPFTLLLWSEGQLMAPLHTPAQLCCPGVQSVIQTIGVPGAIGTRGCSSTL